MSPRPEMPVEWLRSATVFRDLGTAELRRLLSRCYTRTIYRSEALLPAGEPLSALHIVISGRLTAQKEGGFYAEYGPGAVLGEIAFFTREAWTETVTAVRETLVLVLDWEEFLELASRAPEYWQAVTFSLAQKVNRLSPPDVKRAPSPRTLAIIPAGPIPVPPAELARIAAAFDPLADCQVLTAHSYGQHLPGGLTLDDPEVMHWLKEQQQRFDMIIRIGGSDWDDWTENAVLDADEVLLAGMHGGDARGAVPLNAVEEKALAIRGAHAARLALIGGTVTGAARSRASVQPWLGPRGIRSHHFLHVEDDESYARFARFVLNRSVGYIACGGGAVAGAHLAVIQALINCGVPVDCAGGTGAGATIAALVADGVALGEAAQLFPLPRSRMEFERALAAIFGAARVEDLAMPFRALSANMSTGTRVLHENGPVMDALVANWPPPGVAQPFLTSDGGDHLADGALMDAAPTWLMDSAHSGPNVTVKIAPPLSSGVGEPPQTLGWAKRFSGAAADDGRFGMAEVMLRGLGLRAADAGSPDALILTPPIPVLDRPTRAENQQLLFAAVYDWAMTEFETMRAAGHPLFQSTG